MKSLAFEICSEQAQLYKRLIKENRLLEQENIASLIRASHEIDKLLRSKRDPYEQRVA